MRQPVYKELALTEETFLKIETNCIEVPDYSKLRRGALLGLSKALPPGTFDISERDGGLVIRYSMAEHAEETEQMFSPTTDRNQALSDVKDGYRIARQVSPSVEREMLERTMLKSAIEYLDSKSAFFDREAYREMGGQIPVGAIGVELTLQSGQLVVVEPIDGTPAHREGIERGDRIDSIDDVSVRGLKLPEAVKMLRGKVGTTVKLKVWREGWPESCIITLHREVIKAESVRFRLLEDGIGLIKVKQFDFTTEKLLNRALQDLGRHKLLGLILDLRNNSGGVLSAAVDVTAKFLRSGTPVAEVVGRGPGQSKRHIASDKEPRLNIPLVVMVNKGTAAGAEAMAIALQEAGRAVVLGTNTLGHSSVSSIIPLSDGSAINLTTAKWFTASGRSIEGKGLVPDIQMDEGPIDVRLLGDPERDTYLQRAVKVIRKQ